MSAPWWYPLSYERRWRKLQQIRRVCGRNYQKRPEDRRGQTVFLEGAWIDDIPSFYLSLGEAINGRNGYFGACLDSLSDCLCGGFGALPPLTLQLSHYEKVRERLDSRAWCRRRAECFLERCKAGETFECPEFGSYFDALLVVLQERGVDLVPDNARNH